MPSCKDKASPQRARTSALQPPLRSPVVQIGPVGGPPRRSADKTPKLPPLVRIKNLQVARSTRAANARNLAVVQVLVTAKRVRNFRFYIEINSLRRKCRSPGAPKSTTKMAMEMSVYPPRIRGLEKTSVDPGTRLFVERA
jgi:hypothetical protein